MKKLCMKDGQNKINQSDTSKVGVDYLAEDNNGQCYGVRNF